MKTSMRKRFKGFAEHGSVFLAVVVAPTFLR